MKRKTIRRWAVHKLGSEQFGSICSFESEANDLLQDLKRDILNMPEEEKNKFKVVAIDISWDE